MKKEVYKEKIKECILIETGKHCSEQTNIAIDMVVDDLYDSKSHSEQYIDGLFTTLIKIADYLGIDYKQQLSASDSDRKPSDVFIDAIKYKVENSFEVSENDILTIKEILNDDDYLIYEHENPYNVTHSYYECVYCYSTQENKKEFLHSNDCPIVKLTSMFSKVL